MKTAVFYTLYHMIDIISALIRRLRTAVNSTVFTSLTNLLRPSRLALCFSVTLSSSNIRSAGRSLTFSAVGVPVFRNAIFNYLQIICKNVKNVHARTAYSTSEKSFTEIAALTNQRSPPLTHYHDDACKLEVPN